MMMINLYLRKAVYMTQRCLPLKEKAGSRKSAMNISTLCVIYIMYNSNNSNNNTNIINTRN